MEERISILCIDDDEVDARLIERTVRAIRGFEASFRHIEDPDRACEVASLDAPSIILLDYFLPGRTGLEVLESLRAAGCDSPIIFLTDQRSDSVAADLIKAGAADYMSKSVVSPSSLFRSITNSLRRQKLRRELAARQAELQRMNSDLERRNDEIQSFYHTLSHELKTPLTAAHSFLTILIDGISGDLNDDQKEYAEIALSSCEQIHTCIDDLLDATRLETGKLELRPEPTPIGGLIERVIASMQPRAAQAKIALTTSIAPGLPDVMLDEVRITQVLSNLLTNAIKFSEPDSAIEVEAKTGSEDMVAISIRDSGRGIDPEAVERIFDRLYQVERGDSTGLGGLGIGLNLCKELVQLHGGRIRVESQPGLGSTFTFTLPFAGIEMLQP